MNGNANSAFKELKKTQNSAQSSAQSQMKKNVSGIPTTASAIILIRLTEYLFLQHLTQGEVLMESVLEKKNGIYIQRGLGVNFFALLLLLLLSLFFMVILFWLEM
jgi:hypothetical protein